MSNVTLYSAMPSRGMIPHWALEESGIDYELILLDLNAEAHKRPDYLALNPLGKVPTLVHATPEGDVIVTESAAIVAYVAETFADGRLEVPKESPNRGSYLRWLHFSAGSAEGAVIWHMLGAMVKDSPYQPFASAEAVVDVLAPAVDGKTYVLEDRFTAADIMIGSVLMWGLTMVPALPQDPRLTRYWQGLSERGAWQRVQALLP